LEKSAKVRKRTKAHVAKSAEPAFYEGKWVLPESLGLMLAEKVEFSIMEAIEFESKERLVTKAVGLGAINKFV